MYTSTTRTVLGEFSELQYSLSPSYQAERLLVIYHLKANEIENDEIFFMKIGKEKKLGSNRVITIGTYNNAYSN